MVVTSAQVVAAGQWLRDLIEMLSAQEEAVSLISSSVGSAVDTMSVEWLGPSPDAVEGCIRSYQVEQTPAAMYAAHLVLSLWAGFADTVARASA